MVPCQQGVTESFFTINLLSRQPLAQGRQENEKMQVEAAEWKHTFESLKEFPGVRFSVSKASLLTCMKRKQLETLGF